MKSLVIYGVPTDPHIVRVSNKVGNLGINVVSYSSISEARLGDDETSWSSLRNIDSSFLLVLPTFDGRKSNINPRECVWWMRNKYRLYSISSTDDQRRHFELDTRDAWMRSFVFASGARTVNGHPLAQDSSRKIVQLETASSLGFPIPATLVSNSKENVVKFLRQYPRSIIKPLQTSYIPPMANKDGVDETSDISILTNRISLEEALSADESEFLSAPTIVQEEVEKAYELRVVAFGQDVRAYRILSQRSEFGRLDWRRAEQERGIVDDHEYKLDERTTAFVKEFLKRSYLDTGVFDFAVDTHGHTIFFECNPAGQWGSLEPNNGDPIAVMFANNIARFCSAT